MPSPPSGRRYRSRVRVRSASPSLSRALVTRRGSSRLAGATLCAVAPSRLCLFGGRDSASGDTLDATHLAQIRGGVAIWDVLLAGGQVR